MNYRLPKVTGLWVASWLASVAAAETTATKPLATTGQRLIQRAAENLAQQPALAARLRQRAQVLGQHLVGSGTYQQLRIDQQIRIRLELRLQASERKTTLLQINDGATLWTRRDEGEKTSVGYVDLRRVHEAISQANAIGNRSGPGDALAFGGLPELLRRLNENFAFVEPVAGKFASVPVWIVRGHWKPDQLASYLPDGKMDGDPMSDAPWDRLPAHLPHSVELCLGRDDFLPLFPYRIEYSRRATAPEGQPDATPVKQPLVTIELFEVRRNFDYDPLLFVYQLGEQVVEDQTAAYLQRFGLPAEVD
jgi:hypothetical protein